MGKGEGKMGKKRKKKKKDKQEEKDPNVGLEPGPSVSEAII